MLKVECMATASVSRWVLLTVSRYAKATSRKYVVSVVDCIKLAIVKDNIHNIPSNILAVTL